jgi:3-hydroxy-9,10-secoandrosta-1,3,5(10)-triene-9,17-dione monooxygenase reductase component
MEARHIMPSSFSQRELRDAFGLFATGVTVITGVTPEGEPVGATANSFTSVSLDPPLLLWCLANTSSTIAAFEEGASFSVHVLSSQQRDIALHFARRTRDKFDIDKHWRSCPSPPHVADVIVRFDCRVHAVYPGGDHRIVIGEVMSFARSAGSPLAFHQGRFGGFVADKTAGPAIDIWQLWHGEWF